MDYTYCDSIGFGWFLTGLTAGLLTRPVLHIFPCCNTPRRVVRYIPIYTTPRVDDEDGPEDEPELEYELEPEDEPELENIITPFQQGDKVIVDLPDDTQEPHFGWGGVDKNDTGIIVSSSPEDYEGRICYRVDFPNHTHWLGLRDELRKVA